MSRLCLCIPSRPGCTPRQHLDLETLLAWVRTRGIQASAFDTALSGTTPRELLGEAKKRGARLVYWHLPHDAELAEMLRCREGLRAPSGPLLQVAGGGCARAWDRELLERLPQLGAVVRGELELPILALLQGLEAGGDAWTRSPGCTVRTGDQAGGLRRNPPTRPGIDLAELPPAASDLFHPDRLRRGQSVLLSRGCNSDCLYCGLQTVYRESFPAKSAFWRCREPTAVVDEIEHFAHRHGVRLFHLEAFVALGYDTAGTDQIRGVADELIRRRLGIRFSFVTHPGHLVRNQALVSKLRQAGLASVTLGLDSGSPTVLDRLRVPFRIEDSIEALRLLHRHRIPFHPLLIFYEPRMSLAEVRQNLSFLRRIARWFSHLPQPYSLHLCRDLLGRILWVSRQTPIHARLEEEGLWEPGEPGEPGRTYFRDPRVERFYRGHRTLVQPLLSDLGSRLTDPGSCRATPGLALLPLDVLDRWLEMVTEDRADDDRSVRELSGYLERRLRELQGAGVPDEPRDPATPKLSASLCEWQRLAHSTSPRGSNSCEGGPCEEGTEDSA